MSEKAILFRLGMLWYLGKSGSAGVAKAIEYFIEKYKRSPLGIVCHSSLDFSSDSLPVLRADWVVKGHIFLVMDWS